MIYPLDQIASQVSRVDQQLLYHLILEQQETNRLLRSLAAKEQGPMSIDELKRPELMKRMAKLSNKPKGWNSMTNEEIIEHLKGESA